MVWPIALVSTQSMTLPVAWCIFMANLAPAVNSELLSGLTFPFPYTFENPAIFGDDSIRLVAAHESHPASSTDARPSL